MAGKKSDKTSARKPATRPTTARTPMGRNEGEGSQTGARQYNDATREFVARGKVKRAAEEAAKAVAGPEAESLKRAEEEGKRHSHGEDPALRDEHTSRSKH